MKPALTAIPMSATQPRPWWLWPNLLSLDAPLVAVVWQELWAQCLVVEISYVHRALLVLATWLAYSGDRLLDVRCLKGPVDSPRHEFSRCHFHVLSKFWAVAFALAIVFGLQLPLHEIICALVLLFVLGGYFLLHHSQKIRKHAGKMKEILAGLIFASGTIFFVVIQVPHTTSFMLIFVAWVALCCMNCLMIACWDRVRDVAMGQHSLAQCWTDVDRWFWLWAVMIMVIIALAWAMDARFAPIAAALLLSALVLTELARGKATDSRRVLADVVLLTPIFFL
jgi:hypothetical protein